MHNTQRGYEDYELIYIYNLERHLAPSKNNLKVCYYNIVVKDNNFRPWIKNRQSKFRDHSITTPKSPVLITKYFFLPLPYFLLPLLLFLLPLFTHT